MKLYTINNDKLKSLSPDDFKLEREIQNLIENNLDELFNLQFVKSELKIKNFRIDTLGYDKENKSFVVIEYKRERNFSVIDQGYTYMSLMLNNKSDFILEYNEVCDGQLRRDDVDWSQSKVIFISPQYSEYQKHSVNFKDVPFELWEIKRYKQNLIGLIQHKTNSEESISTTTPDKTNVVNQVSNQIKIYSEEFHLNSSNNRPEWVNELYFKIKEKILNLKDVEMKHNKYFISFRNKSPFADIMFYNNGLKITLNMREGTLKDPEQMMENYNRKGHWGNGDYFTQIDTKTDLDYLMFLINQSYQNKI